jgi:UDP-glucose:(heptosyl)LPS alpha-1,3-glucosyltransferase
MHLAFTLFRYFPFGGMQRDMLATAQLCAQRGHQVSIYCHTWQGERPRDITVTNIEVRGTANHVRARRFDRALQQSLRTQRPDVVIGFDKLSGLDLYFAADPCFVTRTAGRWWPLRQMPRYRTFRKLEGEVFAPSATTRILLLDERERHNYQRAWQTPTRRFLPLPPGIARDRCRGADADTLRLSTRKDLGIEPDTHLVLLLAANFELKGLDRAMHAIASLPDSLRQQTHLLAVGQKDAARWQQLAKQLHIAEQVTLLPGRTDIPRLLQAADLLVHPARRDTTGTVLLEALVAGLPVLCSAACGYAHYMQTAGCGRVLPEPFAQSALNEALLALLTSDTTQLRAAAIRYAQNHDLHGMHDEIVRVIES